MRIFASYQLLDFSLPLQSGCLTFKTTGLNREGNYTLIVSNVYGSDEQTQPVHFHHQQTLSSMQFGNFNPGLPMPPHLFPFPSLPDGSFSNDGNSKNSPSSAEEALQPFSPMVIKRGTNVLYC